MINDFIPTINNNEILINQGAEAVNKILFLFP